MAVVRFTNSWKDFKYATIAGDGRGLRMHQSQNQNEWVKMSSPTDSEFDKNFKDRNLRELNDLDLKSLKLKILGSIKFKANEFPVISEGSSESPKLKVPVTVYVTEDTKTAKEQDERIKAADINIR